jgi:hypothetical protein
VLVATVNELTVTVTRQEATWQERWKESDRRLGMIESRDQRERDRGDSTADQRQTMQQMFGLQVVLTLVMFLISVLVAHAWK